LNITTLFLPILLFASWIHGMDTFVEFPQEVNQRIFKYGLLVYTDSPREAAQTISHLTLVNKKTNELMNNREYCLKMIKKLSARFEISHENIAEQLQNREGKYRFHLQSNLYNMCKKYHHPSHKELIYKKLTLFKHDGADFNFTYRKNAYSLLMALFGYTYLQVAEWLIQHKADITICDKEGNCFLQSVIHEPRVIKCLKDHPQFDCNFQDKNGRTFLINIVRHATSCHEESETFVNLMKNGIKELIKLGADIRIKDKKGKTVLDYAQNNKYGIFDFLREQLQEK
jgi:ankyrin repeat protein